MAAAANSDDILHDFSPLLRHYKDGRIERLMGLETIPPSLDPNTGVQSKDVQIAPDLPLSARLYLPKTAAPGKKLPLLVYFHGGGFIIHSAFSSLYQKQLNLLSAESNVVALSVNYRLAPESPLPRAYEDAWEALKWTASESTDDWIKHHADLDRVYLGGDRSGANIAHNTAVRLDTEKLEGMNCLRLRGMFLNCPLFWGKDPMGRECAEEVAADKSFVEKVWYYAWPGLSGMDEARINPGMDENLWTLGCGRVLVYVGEADFLKERGWHYKEVLERSGWSGEVEAVEVAGEGHVFSVISPEGENAQAMFKKVASFINPGS